MFEELLEYKIAFRVPIIFLLIGIFFIYENVIIIDAWFANDFFGGGYQVQINLNYLLELIYNKLNELMNFIMEKI